MYLNFSATAGQVEDLFATLQYFVESNDQERYNRLKDALDLKLSFEQFRQQYSIVSQLSRENKLHGMTIAQALHEGIGEDINPPTFSRVDYADSWSIKDKIALADLMLARWEGYREAVIHTNTQTATITQSSTAGNGDKLTVTLTLPDPSLLNGDEIKLPCEPMTQRETTAIDSIAIHLNVVCRKEDEVWVAECLETGTATFGENFLEARMFMLEAIALHMNTLEQIGESERFLRGAATEKYRKDLTPFLADHPALKNFWVENYGANVNVVIEADNIRNFTLDRVFDAKMNLISKYPIVQFHFEINPVDIEKRRRDVYELGRVP